MLKKFFASTLFVRTIENKALIFFTIRNFSKYLFFRLGLDYCGFVTRMYIGLASLEDSAVIVLYFGLY